MVMHFKYYTDLIDLIIVMGCDLEWI